MMQASHTDDSRPAAPFLASDQRTTLVMVMDHLSVHLDCSTLPINCVFFCCRCLQKLNGIHYYYMISFVCRHFVVNEFIRLNKIF